MRSPRLLDLGQNERFEVRRPIGEGGTGVVYEAYDRAQRTRVALKTLRHLDPESLYRFKREFREAQDIEHPNLVTLGELIGEGDQWFFTMELVEGVDFTSWVCPGSGEAVPSSRGRVGPRVIAPFDEARLRAALRGLADGLNALHARGKVHRDIKPSNVLVTLEGRVVLLDFGLLSDARATSDAGGTLAYMAPEQVAAEAVEPAADWYALGAMLFEALTARAPFEGGTIDVLRQKLARATPPPARAINAAAPADLDALCSDLLAPDPRVRPDGRAVLERLAGGDAPERRRLPFVGREGELAALADALEESRLGQAVAVVIDGEAGMGKSALVAEMLRRVRKDAVLLVGRCFERASAPYKGLDAVVEALVRHLGSLERSELDALMPNDPALLARIFPAFRRLKWDAPVSPAEPPVDASEARVLAFGAFRALMTRFAARRPVVLVVEDFPWADDDARALIEDLLRPPDTPAILFVVTARSPVGDLPLAAHELHLELLPPADARRLFALYGGNEGDAAVLAERGGHPLFLREIARHADALAPVDTPLEERLRARVSRLDSASRTTIEHIALAEAPIPVEAIAGLAGLEPDAVALAITRLTAADLLRPGTERTSVEVAHDLVRAAVLAPLGVERRRALHAALAEALPASIGEARAAFARVRHLEGAGQAEAAARAAVAAANAAEDVLAFDRSAELLRTALRLGKYDETAARPLRLVLARVLANAGRAAEAADALLAAAETADPIARAELRCKALALLVAGGAVERGGRLVMTLLADVGERWPPPYAASAASLVWQRAKLRVRGRSWTQGGSALDKARAARVDALYSVATIASWTDPAFASAFQARALHEALDAGAAPSVARALVLEAMYLATQGKLGRARLAAAEALALAQARPGDEYLGALVRAAEGAVLYYACEYTAAAPLLRDADERFRLRTTGHVWERSAVRLLRLSTLAALGLHADLARTVDAYARDAVRADDRYTATAIARMHNAVWLARDDVDGACALLDAPSWRPPGGSFHLLEFYDLVARAEVDLYCGEAASTRDGSAARFAALRRSVFARSYATRWIAQWLLGRLAVAEGEDAEAEAHAARLEAEHLPPADVCARLLRASIATAERDDAHALAQLDLAIERGEAAGLLFATAVARRRRGELVGGDEGRALIAEADAWMSAQGIRRPERFAAIVTPPFR